MSLPGKEGTVNSHSPRSLCQTFQDDTADKPLPKMIHLMDCSFPLDTACIQNARWLLAPRRRFPAGSVNRHCCCSLGLSGHTCRRGKRCTAMNWLCCCTALLSMANTSFRLFRRRCNFRPHTEPAARTRLSQAASLSTCRLGKYSIQCCCCSTRTCRLDRAAKSCCLSCW